MGMGRGKGAARALLTTVLVTAMGLVLFNGRAEAAPRGTFLIAETQVGYSNGSAFAESPDGLGTTLTLGAGGKFKGWPVRFYGIANVSFAGLHGTVRTPIHHTDTSRSWFGYSFGLRTLAPIMRNLRLLMDVSLGEARIESRASMHGGVDTIATSDSSLILELGGGLQYRFAYHFSAGVRASLVAPVSLEQFDLLAELAGARSEQASFANTNVQFTLTLHL